MAYRVHTGMNLADGRRLEPGDLVHDGVIPKKSIGWLTRAGHIAHEAEKPKSGSKAQPDPEEG